jgi:hypothetical protein
MKRKQLFVFFVVSLFLIGLVNFFVVPVHALTEYENYATSARWEAVQSSTWLSQTFTVGSTAHTVTSVYLYLEPIGVPTGVLTVAIRPTNSSQAPTDSDLTSGTIAASSVTTAAWYQVSVTEYALSANTVYAIVARDPSDSYPNCPLWADDNDVNGYSGGQYWVSTDSGTIWGTISTNDLAFQIWGNTMNPPTIGQFQAPATAYANKYFFLNATVQDLDGQTDLKNATIQINGTIQLQWINSTNLFSKASDASNYCTLDAANCVSTTLNSTSYRLAWKIRLYWNYTEGAITVNGTAYDSAGVKGTGSQTGLFSFEHNLIVASASVNVTRINPSSIAKFSGQVYYQGTSTPPENLTGVTAYVSLNSSVVGSNSSLDSNGQFQATVTSEAFIGTYTYQLYCFTLGGTSTTNQTVSFIVETVTITFNGPFRINVGTNCSALSVSGEYTTDSSVFDGTIALNDTTFSHITVGRRDFAVSSISGGAYGITALANNPTTYCIWEELNVTITPNATNPDAGWYVSFNVTATYLSDGSNISSFTVNVLRDSVHYSSSSTFTDYSGSPVTHLYTTENITDSTYGITAFTSNTATVVWGNLFVEVNQINVGTSNLNVGSSSLSLYHCRWSSNQSDCTSGTIYVNGTAFSVNSTGWAAVSFNFGTVGLRVLNLTGADVEGVTIFGQVPPNPHIVWNRVLLASGGISVSYLHVGSYALAYYTVEYEYDLSPISDGAVLLNGTAMTYNPGLNRWEQNVTSTLGSCVYSVTSVSGNSHGITVINDAAGYLNCTFYANINMRTVDVDGNPVNQTIVYMNNGTSGSIPPGLPPGTGVAIVGGTSYFTQTVSSTGWANWTGITNGTLHIYAKWYGFTVNSTFTFTMTTDTDLDVSCLCYPFTVSGDRFWAASNATVSSSVYALNILTLQFSAPTDIYLLVSSCNTLPKYITDALYDLSTDFSLGYLRLSHFGNATIKISYESWGDLCVMKTDRLITSGVLAANNLTISFTGNVGDIGTVKVFTGTRGCPVDIGGVTTSSFVSGVVTGIYSFSSSTAYVWMSWTTYGGVSPTTPTVSNLIITVDLGFPAQVQLGQAQGTLNVTWSGYSTIYLWAMSCGDVYSDWSLRVPEGLPLSLISSNQSESIPVTLTIPQNATLGTHQVPCIIVFASPTGATKTFQVIVSLTVSAPSAGGSDLLTYIFLGLFGSLGVGILLGGNEVRKRKRAVPAVQSYISRFHHRNIRMQEP